MIDFLLANSITLSISIISTHILIYSNLFNPTNFTQLCVPFLMFISELVKNSNLLISLFSSYSLLTWFCLYSNFEISLFLLITPKLPILIISIILVCVLKYAKLILFINRKSLDFTENIFMYHSTLSLSPYIYKLLIYVFISIMSVYKMVLGIGFLTSFLLVQKILILIFVFDQTISLIYSTIIYFIPEEVEIRDNLGSVVNLKEFFIFEIDEIQKKITMVENDYESALYVIIPVPEGGSYKRRVYSLRNLESYIIYKLKMYLLETRMNYLEINK